MMYKGQKINILYKIIELKNKEIELLEDIIAKPEIIGKVRSIEYINKRFEIQKKIIELEAEAKQ